MAKLFSVASWNVKNFDGKPKERVGRVVEFLLDAAGGNAPDVFGLYEIVGKDVYGEFVGKMPGYTFHITEGQQTQEILVGIKTNLTAFFTQRLEFKSGITVLRPGALVSLRIGGKDYSLLFLHTKSSTVPIGLGVRDNQFEHVFELKKALDKGAAPDRASFLFLGDLNTMGMEYPFDRRIAADVELEKLDASAAKCAMRRLVKSAQASWWNGKGSSAKGASNLDHVVAADHLSLRKWSGAEVSVRGWPALADDAARKQWIKDYSDHGLLYFEVEGP